MFFRSKVPQPYDTRLAEFEAQVIQELRSVKLNFCVMPVREGQDVSFKISSEGCGDAGHRAIFRLSSALVKCADVSMTYCNASPVAGSVMARTLIARRPADMKIGHVFVIEFTTQNQNLLAAFGGIIRGAFTGAKPESAKDKPPIQR